MMWQQGASCLPAPALAASAASIHGAMRSAAPTRADRLGSIGRTRDLRVDFFRGLSLFIILVSHMRGDWLSTLIPARFGFSDAADVFVFVSGYSTGLAFGPIFERRGWGAGAASILSRIWTLYTTQLSMVVVVAGLGVVLDAASGEGGHIALLSLGHVAADPSAALLGVATLTYVPHYLDILPMYIVVMAMVPMAMILSTLHRLAVPVASVALWALARHFEWNLPTEAADPRGWYFDPFCWQLEFFTGLSVSMGWLKPPMANRRLLGIAGAFLVAGVALTVPVIFQTVPGLAGAEHWILDHADKTTVDPLQYLHFLALAYVVVSLMAGRLHLLNGWLARPIISCGRQSLPVFVVGVILAHLGGAAFDHFGTNASAQILINTACFSATLAVGICTLWIKGATNAKR